MVHEIVERKHLWRFHLDVADSRVPTQRGRDKIQPASVPCQPKLAKSLRDTEGALHDEILQGRARFALLRCLVLVEAGVGVWEHDDMLVHVSVKGLSRSGPKSAMLASTGGVSPNCQRNLRGCQQA